MEPWSLLPLRRTVRSTDLPHSLSLVNFVAISLLLNTEKAKHSSGCLRFVFVSDNRRWVCSLIVLATLLLLHLGPAMQSLRPSTITGKPLSSLTWKCKSALQRQVGHGQHAREALGWGPQAGTHPFVYLPIYRLLAHIQYSVFIE